MQKLSSNAREQAMMLEDALHDTFSKGRRDFLKKGSLVALAAASLPVIGGSLASCSSSTAPTSGTSNDVSTLSINYLIEKLAINTYTVAAGTNLLTGAFLDVATSFISDHAGHAATFKSVIVTDLNGPAPTDPLATENFTTGTNNGLLFKITPSFGSLTSAEGIIKYALALELTAATHYFGNATNMDATQRLSSAAALNAVMDIAPVEMEHAAVYRAALKLILNTTTDQDDPTNVGNSIAPRSYISLETPRP